MLNSLDSTVLPVNMLASGMLLFRQACCRRDLMVCGCSAEELPALQPNASADFWRSAHHCMHMLFVTRMLLCSAFKLVDW